jgi:cytochrome c biogenesis protein CcmG/thiol:disulfide interchange protein DsbE
MIRIPGCFGGVLNSSTTKGTKVHEGGCHSSSSCIFVPFARKLGHYPHFVIILSLFALAGCHSSSRPPRIGSAAPDFTVHDSDRTVTLSQLKGQVVVLNFWATWCAPCVEEVPSLVQMQERMKAKGITVLAVSVDVDDSNYRRFVRDHSVNLLTVRDADQKSNALYGTFKFPETYVIDRNGVVRRKFIGAVDWTEPDVIEYLGKL